MIASGKCPSCGREHPPNGLACENCGTVLRADTTVWKTSNLKDIERPTVRPTEFSRDTLYLYIAGAPNHIPIQIPVGEAIILGRNSDKIPDSSQVVDLSEFHAYALGVSRQHARIRYGKEGYTVEDLDSSNGTLLNANRLPQHQISVLHSGDHLQLGDMLILVYFV